MQAWPSFDPGRMIHRVTILAQASVSDASGNSTVWDPFVTSWAAIDPMRGIDLLKAGQETTNTFLTITMYWQAGILPNMRVQAQMGTYIIQSIENPQERNVLLVLSCVGLGANE